jgi:hypothetical protein
VTVTAKGQSGPRAKLITYFYLMPICWWLGGRTLPSYDRNNEYLPYVQTQYKTSRGRRI